MAGASRGAWQRELHRGISLWRNDAAVDLFLEVLGHNHGIIERIAVGAGEVWPLIGGLELLLQRSPLLHHQAPAGREHCAAGPWIGNGAGAGVGRHDDLVLVGRGALRQEGLVAEVIQQPHVEVDRLGYDNRGEAEGGGDAVA